MEVHLRDPARRARYSRRHSPQQAGQQGPGHGAAFQGGDYRAGRCRHRTQHHPVDDAGFQLGTPAGQAKLDGVCQVLQGPIGQAVTGYQFNGQPVTVGPAPLYREALRQFLGQLNFLTAGHGLALDVNKVFGLFGHLVLHDSRYGWLWLGLPAAILCRYSAGSKLLHSVEPTTPLGSPSIKKGKRRPSIFNGIENSSPARARELLLGNWGAIFAPVQMRSTVVSTAATREPDFNGNRPVPP